LDLQLLDVVHGTDAQSALRGQGEAVGEEGGVEGGHKGDLREGGREGEKEGGEGREGEGYDRLNSLRG